MIIVEPLKHYEVINETTSEVLTTTNDVLGMVHYFSSSWFPIIFGEITQADFDDFAYKVPRSSKRFKATIRESYVLEPYEQ